MSKKRILIILLILAAAYIAWRKGLFAKLTGNAGSTAGGAANGDPEPIVPSSSNPDLFNKELNSFVSRQKKIASKLGLTAVEKEKFMVLVRSIYVWCHDDDEDHWTAEKMAATARNNGFTLDQQYAISALWAMCPEGWSEEVITKNRYSDLAEKIKTLK